MKTLKELRTEYKTKLRQILYNGTNGCCIQYQGFPCGTCFFITEELTNRDWQMVLLLRGDTKIKDLDNLPEKKDWENTIKNIIKIYRQLTKKRKNNGGTK